MLCMLKELSMLDANGKYDEPAALVAFRKYWTDIVDTKLQSVNSNCAAFGASFVQYICSNFNRMIEN